jgi:hypothetical protein
MIRFVEGGYADTKMADIKKEIYLVFIVLLLVIIQLTNSAGVSFDLKEKVNMQLRGGEIDTEYEEILPEAGHCTDKGIDVNYGTYLNGGVRTPIEYCRIDKFCVHYDASVVLSEDNFDEDKLQRTIDANPDRFCFTEEVIHTQRNWITDIPDGDSLKAKFVCCTNEDPEEQNNCELNTCNGRYTGVRDGNNCRIYAIETEGGWVAECGGFHAITVN